MPATRDMADFYRRYPYPWVPQIEWDHNLHDHFRYLAHGCVDNPAPRRGGRRARMLIAGCGTREAVMWGASLPWFDIDAVDLSEASLEISGALAEQLRVSNVRFCRGDFEAGEGLDGPYDFISSFGVLHHLASPEAGLAQLKAHLAPHGLMALMVYSDTNRGPLQRAQRLIDRLCAAERDDPAALEAAASSIVEHGARTGNRLRGVFQVAARDRAQDPPQFADTMLNPREVSYTIPTLVEWLATADLELVSPAQPVAWDPVDHLPPERYAAWRALPLAERLEISDSLMGPLFWILARPRGAAQPRPCLEDPSLFWEIVPMPMDTGAWPVQRLIVGRPVKLQPRSRPVEGDLVAIHRQEKHPRVFHKIAWRMVEGFDGARTLRQIAAAAAQAEGTELRLVEATLERLLRRLIDEMAIGTPDVTRCARCPLRGG